MSRKIDVQRFEQFQQALADHIVILDGGMGTMIQRYDLQEADYRGEQFADWPSDVKGNNDLLVLSQPDIIKAIQREYLEAGAEILETNTFNATTISQADYGMEELVDDLNREGARLAREVADAVSAETGKTRYVAGVLGPTSRTASISPDVNDPGFRNVSYDELVVAYRQAARALIEGGSDFLLIETIFDTLNAKAAISACLEELEADGWDTSKTLPIMLSGTITDASGRTLSGQVTEAFWYSTRHAKPVSVGLNCALGPDALRQYVAELSRVSESNVSTHPNAGLPNEFGEYDLGAEEMAEHIKEWAESGLMNIVGGCCGTTPGHIAAMAKAVEGIKPRTKPDITTAMRLSGLEPFVVGN